jgi:hypothetical protein
MSNFLRNFSLDRLSFWVGILSASVFWWLYLRLRPFLRQIWNYILNNLLRIRQRWQIDIETKHRKETLKIAQGMHLASPLFSLDEILIPPCLMAPPPFVEPTSDLPPKDVVTQNLYFTPDFPELLAAYRAPTLNITEALDHGSNLQIIGLPGSGKSVTLAHLASLVARKDPACNDMINHVPILVHAADIRPPVEEIENPITTLTRIFNKDPSSKSHSRYYEFLKRVFNDQRALLLIDGIDELPSDQVEEVTDILKELLELYPGNRSVITSQVDDLDSLPPLGFSPIPMAIWGQKQQAQFLQKWAEIWKTIKQANESPQNNDLEHVLINSWLFNQDVAVTPLEFTLKVWSAYAGDTRGNKIKDSIEAYINRMITVAPSNRSGLEQISLKTISLRRTRFSESELKTWLTERSNKEDQDDLLKPINPVDKNESFEDNSSTSEIVEEALQNGVMVRIGQFICFSHPMILGYLASRSVTTSHDVEILFDPPTWCLKDLTIGFLLSQLNVEIEHYIDSEEDDDYLLRKQLKLSKWLPHLPSNHELRSKLLRVLTRTIRDDNYPMGTRMSALTAIAVLNDPEVMSLFRHLLKSKSSNVRKLAALGCGYCRDLQSVNNLIDLIKDLPSVSQCACLALVNIGSKPALDAVASTLLHGDEKMRTSAAEALANHPTEGHLILKEGTNIDDLLLRRAVVHGLKRVEDPWSTELLENLQIEDEQWVVRNAAQEILELKDQPDPHIPHPINTLEETPWLIAFASDRGLGVSPGKPARDMLITALKEGNELEQLAAMYYIRHIGESDVYPILYKLIFSDSKIINNAAYTTLWQLKSMGIDIPSHPS